MLQEENPFKIYGYFGPDFFCGRTQETKAIKDNLINGNNVALISPRRMGKSALVQHVFEDEEIRRNYHCFFVDIYATQSLEDFVAILGKRIIEGLKKSGRMALRLFYKTIRSFRPVITLDPINNSFSIEIGSIKNPAITLDEIFTYLNEADKPCILAIDEFQQIAFYGDKSVEETLRAYIYRCNNAKFIFTGSQREMVNTMFFSHPRPFYYSVSIVNLRPLELEVYKAFCVRIFEVHGRHLDGSVVDTVYHSVGGVTLDMQRIMNVLFFMTKKNSTCVISMVPEAIETIIAQYNEAFEMVFQGLSISEREVLLAISKEGKPIRFPSKDFLQQYGLSLSPSILHSVLSRLQGMDLIEEILGYCSICNRFFVLWLKSKNLI